MHEGSGKPKWDKPKLVILIRGKPEEQILSSCKTDTISGSLSTYQQYCWISGGVGGCTDGYCQCPCNTRSGS